MVDYLKVKKSVEEDKTIMSAIKDIYTDKDYLRLFQVLDRTLKCVLICMKILVDGMGKAVDNIENDKKISTEEKMKAVLLISDILNQMQETIIGIDECDAVKESWEYTGNPADDLEKIKLGEL